MWIAKSGFIGLVRAFAENSGFLFVVALGGLFTLLYLIRSLTFTAEPSWQLFPEEGRLLACLAIFNGIFIPLNVLMTVAMTTPLTRYVAAPALFAPMIGLLLLMPLARSALSKNRHPHGTLSPS
jgi:hypothetical protein